MSDSLAPAGGGLAMPAGVPAGAIAVPDGTGAVGAANLSMVRMTALLEHGMKGLSILEDVGKELLREVTTTSEIAEYLTASLGERVALDELRNLAQMFIQVVDGNRQLIGRSIEALKAALVANFQVLVVQEQMHALGADGAYLDSQRRAG